MTPTNLNAFKAYDIRGKVPEELNATLAYQIGQAYAAELNPKHVVIGQDIRLESPEITHALSQGLMDSGVNVIDIGLCGTEEVYFNTPHYQADGGIMVTASHNPKGYNGMKLVAKGAVPISGDSGLHAIQQRIQTQHLPQPVPNKGQRLTKLDKTAYITHLLSYINLDTLKPLKLVLNSGNGSAGPTLDQLLPELPFETVLLHHQPDGHFPNGVPNPMIPENQVVTSKAVIAHQADMGIAWDGDFDRCFFFDEKGQFIEGYYLVGLLAETLLAHSPNEKIIHDPRLTWNTIEQVTQAGGHPIQSKTGHAFIKERMRKENAIYGGEMSAHHYFRDFFYCDSGMIPWLLITELLSQTGKTLSELVAQRAKAFPCSGELNYTVQDAPAILQKIQQHFTTENPRVDQTDGLSLEFTQWRMNIRSSNTEPLLRLNVESRGDAELVWQKVAEIEAIIQA